jgi:hypothetical protein
VTSCRHTHPLPASPQHLSNNPHHQFFHSKFEVHTFLYCYTPNHHFNHKAIFLYLPQSILADSIIKSRHFQFKMQSIGPDSPSSHKPPTWLQRFANALAYIIAFPFIAVFIALKRAFTTQKEPSHSYYNKLPEQHYIGQAGSGATDSSGGTQKGPRRRG